MDELDPSEIKDELEEDTDLDDDILTPGKKKPKNPDAIDEESLDTLAEDEDSVLPDDLYDDRDLW